MPAGACLYSVAALEQESGAQNLQTVQPLPSGPAAVIEDTRCSLQACASTVPCRGSLAKQKNHRAEASYRENQTQPL